MGRQRPRWLCFLRDSASSLSQTKPPTVTCPPSPGLSIRHIHKTDYPGVRPLVTTTMNVQGFSDGPPYKFLPVKLLFLGELGDDKLSLSCLLVRIVGSSHPSLPGRAPLRRFKHLPRHACAEFLGPAVELVSDLAFWSRPDHCRPLSSRAALTTRQFGRRAGLMDASNTAYRSSGNCTYSVCMDLAPLAFSASSSPTYRAADRITLNLTITWTQSDRWPRP